MGCGASTDEIINRENLENDFYKEAFAFKMETPGALNSIITTDEIHKNMTYKIINQNNPEFSEENMEFGKEETNSKPWLNTIYHLNIPHNNSFNLDNSPPSYTLQIEHIHGYHIDDVRSNLFFVDNDYILFTSSSCAIIHNVCDNTQKIFGCDSKGILNGAQINEKLCHDGEITAIDFYQSEGISFVATGQRGNKPKIFLWSPKDCKTIYAKYSLPNESKEVSGISIDRKGRFIASFGKDSRNSFYIFDIQKQSIVWEEATDRNINLQIKYGYTNYNKSNQDEICIVGYKKILFINVKNKKQINFLGNLKDNKELYEMTYTCCKYVNATSKNNESNNIWLIGAYSGGVLMIKNMKLTQIFDKFKGSIEQIYLLEKTAQFIISDSRRKVVIAFINNNEKLEVASSQEFESAVKAMSVNNRGEIVFGLRGGKIKLFDSSKVQDNNISKLIYDDLIVTHRTGGIYGIDIIDEKRLITVGEDNQILVYNYKVNKVEDIGVIAKEQVHSVNSEDGKFRVYYYTAQHKAWAVSYNKIKEHVAIGICDGLISIRKNPKNLNEHLFNVAPTPNYAITALKYTNYGDYLTAAILSHEIVVLDPNNNYEIINKIDLQLNSCVTAFDYDLSNKYIQVVTNMNTYEIYTLPNLENNIKKIPSDIIFPEITCKFGPNVMGLYMGSTNPTFIRACCKHRSINIICSGDDDLSLNLYNFPANSDNAKVRRFFAHSTPINQILITPNNKVITIAGKDKAIFIWNLEGTKNRGSN